MPLSEAESNSQSRFRCGSWRCDFCTCGRRIIRTSPIIEQIRRRPRNSIIPRGIHLIQIALWSVVAAILGLETLAVGIGEAELVAGRCVDGRAGVEVVLGVAPACDAADLVGDGGWAE